MIVKTFSMKVILSGISSKSHFFLNQSVLIDQAIAVKAELSAAVQTELDAFEQIKQDKIKALNEAIRAASIDAILVD